jgi:RNA polymerase sigma-70 factor (ECF subfamily)
MSVVDDDLLRRAQSGDREAIEALLTRHQPDFRRFARRVCRTSEDADDATQYAMVQLSSQVSAFRGVARLTSWLFTIIKRECLRLIRKFRRDAVEENVLDERLGSARDPDTSLRSSAHSRPSTRDSARCCYSAMLKS